MYKSYSSFLKDKFNSKVFKIPISLDNTCPNKATGGCIFCKDYSKSNISIGSDAFKQYYNIVNSSEKYKSAKHIIYFQSGTNTFMNFNVFKQIVEDFLKIENVVGISIATRSDCITEDYLNYFKNLNKRTFLSIELGLQSSNDNTLEFINRGHDAKNFADMVERLHKLNIYVCVHIINGLPYETEEDMLNTIKFLNKLDIDALKIHILSVLKGTKLEKLYNEENFHLISEDEYIDIVCKQIRLLNKNTVIERLTADPIKEDIIEPKWYTSKIELLNKINNKLKTYE